MAGLGDLAAGLRLAGGTVSQPVFNTVAAENERNDSRAQQMRLLALQQTIRGIESGSIDPQQGSAALKQLGFDVPVGPSPEARTRLDALETQKAITQLAPQFMENGRLNARKLIGAVSARNPIMGAKVAKELGIDFEPKLIPLGDGASLYDPTNGKIVAENAKTDKPMEGLPEVAKLQEVMAKLPPGDPRRAALQNRINILTTRQPGAVVYLQTDNGYVAAPTRGVPPGPVAVTGAQPEGGQLRGPSMPLPQGAQENLLAASQAWRALDMIDAGIGETGRIKGVVSKAQTLVGANEKAIAFETGRDNFRIQAQALIKGIPSNFDVQTLMLTFPAIHLPEPVNKSRAAFARESFNQLVQDTISYYKGTKYQIPVSIVAEAKKRGIDVDSVRRWDGQSDPFASTQAKLSNVPKATQAQSGSDPLGIR